MIVTQHGHLADLQNLCGALSADNFSRSARCHLITSPRNSPQYNTYNTVRIRLSSVFRPNLG